MSLLLFSFTPMIEKKKHHQKQWHTTVELEEDEGLMETVRQTEKKEERDETGKERKKIKMGEGVVYLFVVVLESWALALMRRIKNQSGTGSDI